MGEDTSESGVTDKDDNENMGLWSRMRKGLAKTRAQLAEGVGNVLLGEREINDEVLEELETALLLTDVGVATSEAIMADLAGQVARQELNNTTALYASLKTLLVQRLEPLQRRLEISHQPHVIFFVGVNGVGKTRRSGSWLNVFRRRARV